MQKSVDLAANRGMSDRFYTCRAKRAGHAAVQSEPGRRARPMCWPCMRNWVEKRLFAARWAQMLLEISCLRPCERAGWAQAHWCGMRMSPPPLPLCSWMRRETAVSHFTASRAQILCFGKKKCRPRLYMGAVYFTSAASPLRMNPAARPHCMLHRPRAKRGHCEATTQTTAPSSGRILAVQRKSCWKRQHWQMS